MRKVALRFIAQELGLPEDISSMKKTAAQYGSGVMKVMKQETKRMGLSNVGDLIRALTKQ